MYAITSVLPKLELTETTGTQKVEFFPVECKQNVTVWLLDTPGFDDTNRTDSEVLKEISAHLADPKILYENRKSKLDGIIYMHRITDQRMGGTAQTNLFTFQKLCGQKALTNVTLATTKWERVSDTEIKGHHQLRVPHQKYADATLSSVLVKGHAHSYNLHWYRKVDGVWKFAGLAPDIRWFEYDFDKVFAAGREAMGEEAAKETAQGAAQQAAGVPPTA